MFSINLSAVFLGGVLHLILGFIWYSNGVFGTMFKQLLGKTGVIPSKSGMGKIIVLSFILAMIKAYVLGLFINLTGAETLAQTFQVAFWAWLGFSVTVGADSVLWEKRPAGLFWLSHVYHLLSFLAMSAIFFWMK